ncbi:isoprenoid biosynthesis glyoxalase ElbB [Agarivorans sp.]|uniref:isoprenoid biosynthesis glyoxalase ElbB n=1 Tax=Agarivorans sp. TaxID=1872412 RepID=UPI003CFC510B
MKTVAVILSGCGHLDGAEIRESVLSLLALELEGLSYRIFAPDSNQFHVVNHLAAEPEEGAERNVLQEAARIARGDISPLAELKVDEFDGLVLPGGFGVAKNLSNFAFKGADGEADANLASVVNGFYQAKKPIAAVCIAPAIIALILGKHAPTLTIGSDPGTAEQVEKTGALHQNCATDDCVVDQQHLLVTSPAYMDDGASIKQVFAGISKAIKAFAALA